MQTGLMVATKVALLLASLLTLLWGGYWYRTGVSGGVAAVSSSALGPSVCQQCLDDGKDYCISSNSCIPRATFMCRGPDDHITGDPEFAKPGFHHRHHHDEWHNHGNSSAREHHHDHEEHHHHHHDHEGHHHHHDDEGHHHDWHHDHEGHRHHGHGHPGHSMVCPVSTSAGTAPERKQCPCGDAKKECMSPQGEKSFDGDCAKKWEACWDKLAMKSSEASSSPGSKMNGSKMCPCGVAKKLCTTPSGEKVLEGDCAKKWDECGEKLKRAKLGFPAAISGEDPKPDFLAAGNGACPCKLAKERCFAADGSKSLDGECAAIWALCNKKRGTFMQKGHSGKEYYGHADPSPLKSPWTMLDWLKHWSWDTVSEDADVPVGDTFPNTKTPVEAAAAAGEEPAEEVQGDGPFGSWATPEDEASIEAYLRQMQAKP